MKNLINISLLAIISVLLFNCKPKEVAPDPVAPPVANPDGSLKIYFEANVGDSELVFNTSNYKNAAGNTFNVTMFRYYISNVKLTKVDGTVWVEANSYHLIDHSGAVNTSNTLTVTNVPFGNYKAIEYVIGVDSAKNAAGKANTGALDPSNGMYWSWNSGYIMAKMEGTSPQSTAEGKKLTFHIGGFGVDKNSPNVARLVSPSLNNDTAKVTSKFSPTIHMSVDLLTWFDGPTKVDFTTFNTVHMPGMMAKNVADNYKSMFSVEHIHND